MTSRRIAETRLPGPVVHELGKNASINIGALDFKPEEGHVVERTHAV